MAAGILLFSIKPLAAGGDTGAQDAPQTTASAGVVNAEHNGEPELPFDPSQVGPPGLPLPLPSGEDLERVPAFIAARLDARWSQSHAQLRSF